MADKDLDARAALVAPAKAGEVGEAGEASAGVATTATPAGGLSHAVRIQVALSFFAFVLIGAGDGALGVLVPSIRTQYSIDKTTLSLLFLASTAGYLLAAFSSGLLLERFGRRAFLVVGTAVYLVGLGSVALALPFGLMLPAFMLIGFGVAVIDAGLNAYVAGLPGSTALLNYLHAFYGFGALVGPLVASGIIALEWQWNLAYVLWAAMALTLVAGFEFAFRGYEAVEHHVHEHPAGETARPQRNVLAAVLRMRVVWISAIFLLFYVGAEVSLGTWSFSFLTEERGQPELFSGWMVSGYWMGLTLGRALLARVALRLGNRRMIELCIAGVVVGVVLIWAVPNGAVMAFGLVLAGFSLGPIFPTVIALMPELVPKRLLQSAVGFLTSFGAMGASLFPLAAGALSDAYGLWTLLPYVTALTTIMLGLWVALQHPKVTGGVRG